MSKSLFYCLILIFNAVKISQCVKDEELIYTSIPDMVKTLSTATIIQEKASQLLLDLQLKLKGLDEDFYELNTIDTSDVLHPIFFVKSILTIDRILEKDYLPKLTTKRLKIDEHIKVLFALQDFYNFPTTEIAAGSLKDAFINISLSALDCYEIGNWALENKDAYHAKLWLNEAKLRLISKSADRTVRLEELLLKVDEFQGSDVISDIYQTTPSVYNWGGSSKRKWVQKLCQEEQVFNTAESPSAICYYQKVYTIYYIKVEIIREEPPVGLLYDIITNKEVVAFHRQAAQQNPVNIAMVDSTSNKIIQNLHRKLSVASMSSLVPFEYTHFDIGEFHNLTQFIKASTNFSQVENNGKGWFYMLFLNNVKGGGRVIFPSLNVSVAPQQGNALVWGFDPRSVKQDFFHTICPIYAGNCTVVLVRGYSNEYYS